jgi:hypothetical protein
MGWFSRLKFGKLMLNLKKIQIATPRLTKATPRLAELGSRLLAEFSFKRSKADSASRRVVFQLQISPRIRSQKRNGPKQIKFFCFCSDTKRTKSKRFAFVPIMRGPNQNVLLWSLSFWIKYKRSYLPKTTSKPNQTTLFCPRIFEPKWKRSACEKNSFLPNQNVLLSFRHKADQIKTFCFRSNNKRTKSKPFALIY